MRAYMLDPVTMTTRPVKSGQSTGGSVVNWDRMNVGNVNFMVMLRDVMRRGL